MPQRSKPRDSFRGANAKNYDTLFNFVAVDVHPGRGMEQARRVMKLYVYPTAPTSEAFYERTGYRQAVPFSADDLKALRDDQSTLGITLTDSPFDADYFFMGQYHDTVSWMLHPNRFCYWQGNESRHIIDIEGDWRDKEIPEWLEPAIVIAMNAFRKHRSWPRLFVRPGCSKLLMALARERLPWPVNLNPWDLFQRRAFWFRGREDSHGLRRKVGEAIKISGVCNGFTLTGSTWGAVIDTYHDHVKRYEEEMAMSLFALCPSGEGFGHMTVRFYEACYYNRIPVVIGDNLWMGEEKEDLPFIFRISARSSIEQMVEFFRHIQEVPESTLIRMSIDAGNYFESVIRPYFADPTAWFLKWKERGMIWGHFHGLL